MSIRIPDLRWQANHLADAVRAEGLDMQRGKVLNLTAKLNGLHNWAHAVALRRAEAESSPAFRFAPTPAWVYDMADAAHPLLFGCIPYTKRLEMFAAIANAGFCPLRRVAQTSEEFSRMIAPNARQVLIAMSYADDLEKGIVSSEFSWCVTSLEENDGDSFAAKDVFCFDLYNGLEQGLALAESDRVETLQHPDAWSAGLAARLTAKGVDWENTDWRDHVDASLVD